MLKTPKNKNSSNKAPKKIPSKAKTEAGTPPAPKENS